MKTVFTALLLLQGFSGHAIDQTDISVGFSTKINIMAEQCVTLNANYGRLPRSEVKNLINQDLVKASCDLTFGVQTYLSGKAVNLEAVCSGSKSLIEHSAERLSVNRGQIVEKDGVDQNLKWSIANFNSICDIPGIPFKITTDDMIKLKIKKLNF